MLAFKITALVLVSIGFGYGLALYTRGSDPETDTSGQAIEMIQEMANVYHEAAMAGKSIQQAEGAALAIFASYGNLYSKNQVIRDWNVSRWLKHKGKRYYGVE